MLYSGCEFAIFHFYLSSIDMEAKICQPKQSPSLFCVHAKGVNIFTSVGQVSSCGGGAGGLVPI